MKRMVTVVCVLTWGAPLWAQSLAGQGSPYDPPRSKPFKKHDHLVIQVVERARSAVSGDMKNDRRSRWETDFNSFVNFDLTGRDPGARIRPMDLTGRPSIDIDARYRQDNLARTTRQFDLTMNITAEIVEVRPNGNVVIQAIRRRTVDSEMETITLSGEVAQDGIVNGVVRSERIVNLNLSYQGTGGVGDSLQQGILGWLLNKLWPF